MSAHDFEKNVQEQMTEFNLTPSESTWTHVELQLKKDKRRRRIIIWLPLFALLGIGGYFFYNQHSSINPDSTLSSKENTITIKEENNTDWKRNQKTEKQTQLVADSIEPSDGIRKPANSDESIVGNTVKRVPQQGRSTVLVTQPRKQIQVLSKVYQQSENEKSERANKISGKEYKIRNYNPDHTSLASGKTREAVDDSKMPLNESEKTWNPSLIHSNTQLLEGSSIPLSFQPSPFVLPPLVAAAKPITADLVIKKKSSHSTSQWQWGANLGWGISRVSEGNFFSGLTAARVADANYSSSVSGPPPAGAGNAQPAAIHAGGSWQAGLFVERKISARFGWSAGIQYGNYSTKSTIGIAVDSQKTISNSSTPYLAVDNYYTSGAGTNYKNRYQFFELPVNVLFQLNKNSRTPLLWNVGLTYSYMIATSALQYDGVSGVYYEDDKLFRRSQWYWQTGLSIGLLSKSKHPLFIGPRLQYNTTNLLNNNSSVNNHLWGGGLQVKWLLKK